MIRASNGLELSFCYPIITEYLSHEELPKIITGTNPTQTLFREAVFAFFSKHLHETSAQDLYQILLKYRKVQKIPFERFSASFPLSCVTFRPCDTQNLRLLTTLGKTRLHSIRVITQYWNIPKISMETLFKLFPRSETLYLENHIYGQANSIERGSNLVNTEFNTITLNSCSIIDQTVESFPRTLRSLTFSHCNITIGAILNLARLRVEHLKLYSCCLRGAHLQAIETLKTVENLNIVGNVLPYPQIKNLLKNSSITAIAMDFEIYCANNEDIKENFGHIRFYSSEKRFNGPRHSI